MIRSYDAVVHLVTAADGAPFAYTLANNAARTESAKGGWVGWRGGHVGSIVAVVVALMFLPTTHLLTITSPRPTSAQTPACWIGGSRPPGPRTRSSW